MICKIESLLFVVLGNFITSCYTGNWAWQDLLRPPIRISGSLRQGKLLIFKIPNWLPVNDSILRIPSMRVESKIKDFFVATQINRQSETESLLLIHGDGPSLTQEAASRQSCVIGRCIDLQSSQCRTTIKSHHHSMCYAPLTTSCACREWQIFQWYDGITPKYHWLLEKLIEKLPSPGCYVLKKHESRAYGPNGTGGGKAILGHHATRGLLPEHGRGRPCRVEPHWTR